jgi:hypothetical protein
MKENTQFDLAMELLITNGFDGLAGAITVLLNTAMRIERSRYLQAEPYERSQRRQGMPTATSQKPSRPE